MFNQDEKYTDNKRSINLGMEKAMNILYAKYR